MSGASGGEIRGVQGTDFDANATEVRLLVNQFVDGAASRPEGDFAIERIHAAGGRG